MSQQLPFLNELQYRIVLKSALAKQGISEQTADMLIASRFPMFLISCLEECSARGIILSEADADEFLWYLCEGPPPKRDDGSAIDSGTNLWVAETVEALLIWASENNRGKPSPTSEAIAKLLLESQPSYESELK